MSGCAIVNFHKSTSLSGTILSSRYEQRPHQELAGSDVLVSIGSIMYEPNDKIVFLKPTDSIISILKDAEQVEVNGASCMTPNAGILGIA